jgi:tetratricopeptide (TPR) repeat protein
MVFRLALRSCLFAALFCATVCAMAQEETVQARVLYHNRAQKKQVREDVRIKDETPREIIIERSNRTEKIRTGDVLDVVYRIPADLNLDIRAKASSAEDNAIKETDSGRRQKLNEAALAGYRDLLAKLAKRDEFARARQHTEFKIAALLARLAEDDSSRLDEAINALTQFKTEHGKSWQVGMVGKLLARAQIAKGDMKAAQATFEEFAHRDDLADEARQEYELLGIRALVRDDNFAEAERKLTALGKTLAKDDPQAARVEIYLAACKAKSDLPEAEKRLQVVIRGDAEPAIKALAYNTLGDCYRTNDRLEKAFWQYLWVDQVYPQDREEHAKALYYLSILFEKVKKSPLRAEACRTRLLTDKLFTGLEYQKLAAREHPKKSESK